MTSHRLMYLLTIISAVAQLKSIRFIPFASWLQWLQRKCLRRALEHLHTRTSHTDSESHCTEPGTQSHLLTLLQALTKHDPGVTAWPQEVLVAWIWISLPFFLNVFPWTAIYSDVFSVKKMAFPRSAAWHKIEFENSLSVQPWKNMCYWNYLKHSLCISEPIFRHQNTSALIIT